MALGDTRLKRSMAATATSQGQTRGMVTDEPFDAHKRTERLQALIKDAGKKVFPILDSLRVHRGKLIKVGAAERQEQIELLYLPSHSPRLNLNSD